MLSFCRNGALLLILLLWGREHVIATTTRCTSACHVHEIRGPLYSDSGCGDDWNRVRGGAKLMGIGGKEDKGSNKKNKKKEKKKEEKKPKKEKEVEAKTSRSLSTAVASKVVESKVENQIFRLLPTAAWTPKEIGIAVLGLIAGMASAAVMILENGFLIDVVAWLCVICGSTTVVLQRKLTDFETFRELNKETREQVNILKASNTRLVKQNKQLASSTAKLEQAQMALGELSSKNGMTVDRLVQQVEEYKKVQAEMKAAVKAKIRQTLLSVVLKSDKDGDFVIDPNELDTVCLRLGMIPNVKFNESAFRKVIAKEGGSITSFSQKHLSDENTMAREGIFVF